MPSSPFPPSDHCNGRVFFNPRIHVNRTWADILKWKREAKPTPWPRHVPVSAPSADLQERLSQPTGRRLRTFWINHSTFLVQGSFGNVLTDPVFSPCAGPWGRLGPARVHAPGLPLERLPRIDVILLSHDHYDHCDLPSLARLARRDDPLLLTPLGNACLGRRAGFTRIVELDWWKTHLANGARFTLVPSRHWSNRLTGKRNARLWGGFFVESQEGARWHFVGDTGYDDRLFHEIRGRLGNPDLAFIPIGAYEPRWFMAPQHCSPAEAVRIAADLGASVSVAMHWGCFQLTDEGRETPVQELQASLSAWQGSPPDFRVLAPGASLEIG